MPALTKTNNLGDLLKYEAPSLYSREQAVVASGQNLRLGTVVGRVSATGKLKALNPDARDGTEIAAGVLGSDIDATLADRKDALLIARHAIVARVALLWPAAITPEKKATAEAQLAALGILVRASA